jgi:hypothetical protein
MASLEKEANLSAPGSPVTTQGISQASPLSPHAAKPKTPKSTLWMSIMSLVVFCYEGFVYNVIFLWRILPAVSKGHLVLPFFFMFNSAWGLAIISYCRARWGDPGTVPVHWYDFVRSVGEALPIVPARHAWQPGRATLCEKCGMPRPERAHHCLTCDMCVLRMDHHCPWINNCVGFGNHKFFLLLGVYGWLSSLVALATCLPELLYCGEAVARMGDGFSLELWAATFEMHEGYVSAGNTIEQATMTVSEAKWRCSSLRGSCKGFCFQANHSNPDAPAKTYFKTKWDNVPNNIHSTGWTSYKMEKANELATSNVFSFLVFGILALFVAVLLYLMLGGHLPLATHNLTTIEANYDNIANPYDHGDALKNCEQAMGGFGPDWFFPIKPWRPRTDGVSFERCDEQWGEDGGEQENWDNPEQKELLWRVRYRVRPPAVPQPGTARQSGFWSCR